MVNDGEDAQVRAFWNKEYLRLKHDIIGEYFNGVQDTPSGSTCVLV